MPRRSWDDPWRQYPASKPLPAEGGIATSKQRGPMAATWWSRRFTEMLESYGLGDRMQRGRRYARTGQVLDVEVSGGGLAAQVQGSRARPYLVKVSLPPVGDSHWSKIVSAMGAKVGFAARLLAGEVPEELEAVFDGCGVPLFARAWEDLEATCSCPDWENPCKHIAAVLYVFADQLDADPWLVLQLRGRNRAALMAELAGPRAAAGATTSAATPPAATPPAATPPAATPPGATPPGAAIGAPGDEVAPWWPFPPSAPSVASGNTISPLTSLPAPDRRSAVLDEMAEPGIEVAGLSLVELLGPLYDILVEVADRPS